MCPASPLPSDFESEDISQLDKILDRLKEEKAEQATEAVDSKRSPGLPSQISKIGKFEIDRLLACHGQATVLLARDQLLDRQVVIKIYHSTGNDFHQLLNEGRVLAKIRSPHVATCYSVEQHDDGLILVLEFVDGETLAELLGDGPLPVEACVDLTRQIAIGLKPAHQLKLLHRDLKPSNIMVQSNGHVKVIDFGLVRSVETDQSQMRSGTPAYMAPETAADAGSNCDERTDIFGIGAILYHMLTGKPLFVGKDRSETRELAARCDIQPIRRDDLPESIKDICRKCLAKDKSDRYSALDDLIADLDQFKTSRVVGRRRLAIASLLTLVCFGAVFAFWFLGKSNGSNSNQRIFAGFRQQQIELEKLIREAEINVSNGDLNGSKSKLNQARAIAMEPKFRPHYLREIDAWKEVVSGLEEGIERTNVDSILSHAKVLNESRVILAGLKKHPSVIGASGAKAIEDNRADLINATKEFALQLGGTNVLTLEAGLLLNRLNIEFPNPDRSQQIVDNLTSIRNSYRRELGGNAIRSLKVSSELAIAMTNFRDEENAIEVLEQSSAVASKGTAPAQMQYFSKQLLLAELYANRHNYPASQACFDRLEKMLPRFPDNWLELAYRLEISKMETFLGQGSYQQSIKAGEKAQEIFATSKGSICLAAEHVYSTSVLLQSYSALGQNEKAKSLADSISAGRKQTFAGESYLLAATMNEISEAMSQIGDKQRAMDSAIEAADAMSSLDKGLPIYGSIQSHNRVLLLAMQTGEFQVADSYAEKAFTWAMEHHHFEQEEWIELTNTLAKYFGESSREYQAKTVLEHAINQIESSMPMIKSSSNSWRAGALARFKARLEKVQ